MQDRNAVVAALEAGADAWSRGDLGAFMQLYRDDSDVIYISGGTIVRGFDAIHEMYETRFGGDARGMGHLFLSVLAYQPLGADYSLVIGRYTLEQPPHESDGDASGHFTMILCRTERGWRILSDHVS